VYNSVVPIVDIILHSRWLGTV